VVYPAFVKSLGITGVGADELLADYRARYPSFATLNPGARETLEALHAHGLKLGIVTNGNGVVQNGKIDAIGVRPLLSCILISELVGLKKPDRAIFDLAAAQLHVAPSDCLFVGDNPEVDVIGANAAGMSGVWFRAGEPWLANAPPPRVAIAALLECLPLCGVPAGEA
jgi:putative hydrolase of the HAD superfamily